MSPNITHEELSPLSDAISDTLYRVQDQRDKAEQGSDDKKVLRKASQLLDTIMNNLNDLAALSNDAPAVRKAMELPDE